MVQVLLSLPPAMAEAFPVSEGRHPPDWVAAADPPGGPLGSGGATVHLLAEAWRTTAPDRSFEAWLADAQKLVLHGGGQSRRLPAYAATGKPLIPLPVLRWSRGQRLDQTLLDLQWPEYRRLLERSPATARVMVTSGDVVVLPGRRLPPLPAGDVVGLGVPLPPETARHFGVFFAPRHDTMRPAFFLQKPSADRIRELQGEYVALADSGVWLLSARAVQVLLARTGWEESAARSAAWVPRHYELYSGFGLSLGQAPAQPDAVISSLTCLVVPLPERSFFHLGTSRQLIESVSQLHHAAFSWGIRSVGTPWDHPHQHLQNSRFELPLRREANHTLWVENSVVPLSWHLECEHVLTHVPENSWDLRLERGICLDFLPVHGEGTAVRFYGIDDPFRGPLGDPGTRWCGAPAVEWFGRRGMEWADASLDPRTDLQAAALFPVLPERDLDPRFLEWLFTSNPGACAEFRRRWLTTRRLSADGLMREVDVRRLQALRALRRRECIEPMRRASHRSVFFQLDLEATARLMAAEPTTPVEEPPVTQRSGDMECVRAQMYEAAVLRARGQDGWEGRESQAFDQLREIIEREARLAPAAPQCRVLEDQIIWGRSPVRLDLAGGWTDTPPYCLEHGGRVVNLAVDLNGQPPLQVFARLAPEPELVIRSIDLGTEQRVRTYEELGTFDQPGSGFALAKAAFALAGFLPRFHTTGGFPNLRSQLEAFGGGIEISLLSAVPKGSGLGTSSILAATLLGTIGELCGLGWDRHVLFTRTLALEQMVTTGGGWQDQAGGLFRGVKWVETSAGFDQRPTLRWLPDHLFSGEYANEVILLYYTGLTRLAKGILQEVVRGVFLNSPDHLSTLLEIGEDAEHAFEAIQRADYGGLAEAIRASWRLNQLLDSGTNPVAVQEIVSEVQDYLEACKLLGAGGGGYLLMLAKDREAAGRIRARLTDRPPNAKARFVDFAVSQTGFKLTRS